MLVIVCSNLLPFCSKKWFEIVLPYYTNLVSGDQLLGKLLIMSLDVASPHTFESGLVGSIIVIRDST